MTEVLLTLQICSESREYTNNAYIRKLNYERYAYTKFQINTNNMTSIADIVPPGVVTGDNLMKLLEHARDNAYALPAVNCTR